MPASAETIAAERKALMRVMVTHPYKIPSRKLNENLLIATWNIEQFSNRHSNRAVQYIAAICERFDIIALQEVKTDLRGLERLQQMLPGNYRILVSDPTGNHERFTFLYDKRSVVPTGLASDIGFNVPARVRAPQRGAARSRAASAVIVFSPVLIGISFRFSGRPRPKKAHNKERRARFSPDAACRRFICAGSPYHGKSRMRVRGFKKHIGRCTFRSASDSRQSLTGRRKTGFDPVGTSDTKTAAPKNRRFEEPPTVDVRQSICAVRIVFCCRSRYGGIDVSDAKKLKVPEVENTKLKKLLADP